MVILIPFKLSTARPCLFRYFHLYSSVNASSSLWSYQWLCTDLSPIYNSSQ